MALVKFRLHHVKNGTGIIRLTYLCEDGLDYVASMKERVKAKHWKEEGRLIPSVKAAGSINRYLDDQQQRVENAIRAIRGRGKPVTRAALKHELTGQEGDFWEYFDNFLAAHPEEGNSIRRVYEMLYSNLRDLEKERRISIDFPTINQNLADMLTDHMRKERYADSSILTTFGCFNALLLRAKERKIVKEVESLQTPARGIDPGAVYTTPSEIRMMLAVGHAFHLPGDAKKVRSLRLTAYFYALGTQLGLRSIDLNVEEKNRAGEFLSMKNQKTATTVLIPISPLAKMILNYFGWKRPKLCIRTFRNHIPVIAMYAGINEPSIHREKIGGEIIETVYKKHELIGPHSMRRSWATNLIKAGANPLDVMRVGGWKSWESFQKYLRMSAHESAEGVAKFL